MRVWML